MSRLFSLNRLGVLRRNSLVKVVNLACIALFAIYFSSMCVVPWVVGDFQWDYVQSVWGRWQGFNVGVLAFLSSVIAFNIARFNSDRQRERDFQAAKAFLPHALDELCVYLRGSADVLKRAWALQRKPDESFETPMLPGGFKEVFRGCIRNADSEVGDYLAAILSRLQIQRARLEGFVDQINDPQYFRPSKINTIEWLVDVGELWVLVTRLFPFARNLEELDFSTLTWEEFHCAYRNLDIEIEQYHFSNISNLESITKRKIETGRSWKKL